MASAKVRRGLRPMQWAVLGMLVCANLGLGLIVMQLASLPVEAEMALGAPTISAQPPAATPTVVAVGVEPALAANELATPTPAPEPANAPAPTLNVEVPRLLVPTIPPAIAPLSQIPSEATITNIIGHKQTWSLSCEARAAADWAGYFGVAIEELTFLSQLPASDDPDLGFVGDVHGAWGQVPPNAYGVHAGPVARLLQQYGLPARQRLYMSLEDLQVEVAAGRPVMVWVVGHVDGAGEKMRYTTSAGRETTVAPFEHTVLVIGYSADTVTVLDGWRRYNRSVETFVNSWATLGNMAIVYAAP